MTQDTDRSETGVGSTGRQRSLLAFVLAPLRWLDRNVEKCFIIIAYGLMAGIIFVEVVRRFTTGGSFAWSTAIPIYMFLWLTWLGAAYNVKKRAHLSFTEVRARLPHWAQYASFLLDGLLWILFSAIVIYWSSLQLHQSYMNFAIVAGTDDWMQWWFYLATPVGFGLIIIRAVQNMIEDTLTFRRGEPFSVQQSLFD